MSRENRPKHEEGANPASQRAAEDKREEKHEPQTSAPARRLGKEAKIGAAVVLVLLAALVVAVVLRLSGWHRAGPVAVASAKGNVKAKAVATKAKQSPAPAQGVASSRDRSTAAPWASAPAPPPWANRVSAPAAEGPIVEKHDSDPFGAGGFPALTAPTTAPTGPKPAVIERHRAEVFPPPREHREITRADAAPTDDPFHRRPAKAADPLAGSSRPPAPPGEVRPGHDDRRGPGIVPPPLPPPRPDDARPAHAFHASAGGESSLPMAHRERGRYDDVDLGPGEPMTDPSYGDPPPPPRRERSYEPSAVGLRREYRAGRTYTVAEGETLFTIARYELGKASRWVEIYELNRHALADGLNNLRPGTRLLLPLDERPEVLAEPSGGLYRR